MRRSTSPAPPTGHLHRRPSRRARTAAWALTATAVLAALSAVVAAPAGSSVLTFANTTSITIPGFGPATPYPSTIEVTGTVGATVDVDVRIPSFTHTFPFDLNIAVVSPDGTVVVLQGRVSDGTDVDGISVTYDDEAATSVPIPMATGSYQPTVSSSATIQFGPGGPTEPFQSTLSAFDGVSPNGTWSLYVLDAAGGDDGVLAQGWELIVTVANTPPTAADDAAEVAEDSGATTIDVLANDTDPDTDDSLTVTSVTQPANGTAGVAPGGTAVLYTPDDDFHGLDSFTYTISDGEATATATVAVTVTPVNDAPVAADDEVEATAGVPVTFDVLGNDEDIDGDSLELTGFTPAEHGTVACKADGDCTYTAEADFTGPDTFTYTVSDGQVDPGPTSRATSVGTVTILVTAPAQGPTTAPPDTPTTAGAPSPTSPTTPARPTPATPAGALPRTGAPGHTGTLATVAAASILVGAGLAAAAGAARRRGGRRAGAGIS